MPGVLSGCCQRKNSRACANERIPRRHALATSHWQRYVSDQNTVAKYRPCSSTFYGNCSFCTLPNVFACQNSLKHFASHFYTLAGNSLPPHQCTQEIPRNNVFRIKITEKCVCVYTLAGNTYPLQRPLAREELLDCAQGRFTEKEYVM